MARLDTYVVSVKGVDEKYGQSMLLDLTEEEAEGIRLLASQTQYAWPKVRIEKCQ